ncbi:MAG: 2-C-methyl-D-erythritol 2,4-cyclodiphosphate synthase, partial [uncultured bacterium]
AGKIMMTKTGIGYDVHKLVEGRKLMIGGVEIPHTHGLLGHSDADVLLHAITDALLGAAGLGDIGEHFPDTDPKFKGADSSVLLKEILGKVKAKGFEPTHVDTVVIAESPKLKNYKIQMKENIAKILELPEASVNIKATTEEGLGFTGKKEGIAAWAVVNIVKN